MPVHPRTLLIIRNPRARAARTDAELWQAAAGLRTSGWDVDVRGTRAAGEATAVARAAVLDGVDIVAACGGDGTVNEVAAGLIGSETALAVVPAGTANIWAREAHVPLDYARAISLIPAARRARVDLGRIDGASGVRHFLLMCGIGLDAAVVRRVAGTSRGKRLMGKAWYGAVAPGVVLRSRPTATVVTVDGEVLVRPLLQLVAGNTRLYGGVMRITSEAAMDDGLLDVCVFSGASRLRSLPLVGSALRGRLHERNVAGVDYLRGQRIEVRSQRPLSVQADGEYAGETPVVISVVPKVITVVVGTQPNVLIGGSKVRRPRWWRRRE